MALISCNLQDLELKPFKIFEKDWALVTAGHGTDHGDLNTMTIAWGALGTIWGKPSATVYIRQTRHTKSFMDSHDTFSLSFFADEHKRALGYLGRVSGKDEDKIAASGLSPQLVGESQTPAFAEADLVIICRKAYKSFLAPEGFIGQVADQERYYPQPADYHTMYLGKVEEVFVKEGSAFDPEHN